MNQDQKHYTMSPMALVTFILVVILGIADLGFVVFGGTGASLSSWIVAHSLGEKSVPYWPPLSLFIFMAGAICAHFWWGMKSE